MPYQVTHYDDMFSVRRVSTKGGSVWPISILASKDSEQITKKQADLCLTRLHTMMTCSQCVPSKYLKSDHHRPVRETPSEWRFAGGPIVARDWMLAGLPL